VLALRVTVELQNSRKLTDYCTTMNRNDPANTEQSKLDTVQYSRLLHGKSNVENGVLYYL